MKVRDEMRDAGQIICAGMARGGCNRRRALGRFVHTDLWGRWCWFGRRRWRDQLIFRGYVTVIGWDEARRERRAWWRRGGGYVGGGDVDAP